jgi:uncharacterized membrane protein
MIKKISLILLIALYGTAGINHFVHPYFYYSLIPPYIPNPVLINIAAGIVEIIAALLLIIPTSRKYGAYLIVAMLIAFIPSHIYSIQMRSGMHQQISIFSLRPWLRLFPLQFILIWWAWSHRK